MTRFVASRKEDARSEQRAAARRYRAQLAECNAASWRWSAGLRMAQRCAVRSHVRVCQCLGLEVGEQVPWQHRAARVAARDRAYGLRHKQQRAQRHLPLGYHAPRLACGRHGAQRRG